MDGAAAGVPCRQLRAPRSRQRRVGSGQGRRRTVARITHRNHLAGEDPPRTRWFRGRRGGLIKKTVVFFLGHTRESSVTLSHEHVGFAWVTPDEALKKLTYPNAKAMLNAALDHLKQTH